jgi:hypothetical protein
VDPKEGLRDQDKVDAFYARQNDTEYDPSRLPALQALRDGQAGAFAIIKMLCHGRCLKSCLRSDISSAAWISAMEALSSIANLPWWTRVWVLQEAILPRGDVIATYGEITVPMWLIEDAGSVLTHHYKGECCQAFWDSLPSSQKQTLYKFARLMGDQRGIREDHNLIREGQIDRLIYLLQRTRHKEATDPRDKVFGLLGLLDGLPNPIDLVPDYKMDVAQLYIDVAVRIMYHSNNLFPILNHELKSTTGTGTGTSSRLPTWTPNWGPQFGNSSDALIIKRLRHFRAWLPCSPGQQPQLLDLTDDYALGVTGLSVDRVTQTTSRPFIRAERDRDIAGTIDELETFFGLDRNPLKLYAGGGFLADAFWRTMVGDLLFDITTDFSGGQLKFSLSQDRPETIVFARPNDADGDMFFLAQMVWKQRPNLALIMPSPPSGELNAGYIARRAEENFWYANDGKVFFRTAKGYIGSGPPDIKVGDCIFLVCGSPVPVVLRRAASSPPLLSLRAFFHPYSRYNLVGYAYVHGVMDGELCATKPQRARKIYLV